MNPYQIVIDWLRSTDKACRRWPGCGCQVGCYMRPRYTSPALAPDEVPRGYTVDGSAFMLAERSQHP